MDSETLSDGTNGEEAQDLKQHLKVIRASKNQSPAGIVFQQSSRRQSASRLLSMPSELRLLILRNLLKHEDVLQPLRWTGRQEYKATVQLSAQLLQTCQQLYAEASHVLYKENIVEIRCRVYQRRHWCDILEASVVIPEKLSEVKDADCTLPVLAAQRTVAGPWARVARSNPAWLIKHYLLLKRFDLWCLNIQYETQDQVFIACRALQDLLHGKEVVTSLLPVSSEPTSNVVLPRTATDIDEAAIFSLNYLRCSAITLQSRLDIQSLGNTITGDSPVSDRLDEYIHFTRKILFSLPARSGPMFKKSHQHELERLSRHLIDYEIEAFDNQLRLLCRHVDDWCEAWSQEEEARLVKRIEETHATRQEEGAKIADFARLLGSSE